MSHGKIKNLFIRLALSFLKNNLTYSFPAGNERSVTFYID